ncbi:diguanylate cyclase [Thauera humireducens]|uniref:diguanylate cyclase n=1 Tax=Thauera humireducens TaxID=1134435 RepID=UPI003C71F2BC
MPETDLEAAAEVAERLRLVAADASVPEESGRPVRFTVSIGVSAMVSDGDDIGTLLNAADRALYAAKNAGRNRVQVGALSVPAFGQARCRLSGGRPAAGCRASGA